MDKFKSSIIIAITSIAAGATLAVNTPIASDEWMRLIITAIAILITGYVIWKSKTEITLNNSVSALNATVNAYKLELEVVGRRLLRCEEEKMRIEAECLSLRGKTDISEVLKLITNLTTMTSEHVTRNEAVLIDIQQKVNGWKLNRREAIRKEER